jgi:secondary thiamine-phosphate synthase enzyme
VGLFHHGESSVTFSRMTALTIRTSRKRELVDVTREVAEVVAKSGMEEGLCSVYVAHATAAVIVNENDDPNVCVDFLDALDRLVPAGIWRHDRVDGNAASHIQAAMLGPGEVIPIHRGKLCLGRWQAIMLAELDGPRERRLLITLR